MTSVLWPTFLPQLPPLSSFLTHFCSSFCFFYVIFLVERPWKGKAINAVCSTTAKSWSHFTETEEARAYYVILNMWKLKQVTVGYRSQDALLQPLWFFSLVSKMKSLFHFALIRKNKNKKDILLKVSSVLDWKQIDFIAQDQFMIVLNKLSLTGANCMPQFTCWGIQLSQHKAGCDSHIMKWKQYHHH